MDYRPTSITEKDAMIIETLSKNSMANISRAAQDILTINEAIKAYKSALSDSLELSLEETDIIRKYSVAPVLGSYTLPAVIVGSRADYNIDSVKQDNERMQELKGLAEIARSQADMYRKIILQNFRDLASEISKMNVFATNI
jgi:hypothetical protein